MRYMYTYEYYSAIKKEWNLVVCDNVNGFYAKWNKSDREKNIAWSNLYVECKKQKQTHRYKQVVSRDKGNCVPKFQTFSYKINKSWEVNVQHGDYS